MLMSLFLLFCFIVIPVIFFNKVLNRWRYFYISCLSILVFVATLWAIGSFATFMSNAKYLIAIILCLVIIVLNVAYDVIKATTKDNAASIYVSFVSLLLTSMSALIASLALVCSVNGLNLSEREEPLQADFSHAIGVNYSVIAPKQIHGDLLVSINSHNNKQPNVLNLTIKPFIYHGSYRAAYLFIGNDEKKTLSAVNIDTNKAGTKLVTIRGNVGFPCGVSGNVIHTKDGVLHCCIIVVDTQGNMEGDFAVLKPQKGKGCFVYRESSWETEQLKSSEIYINRIARSIFGSQYRNIQTQLTWAKDIVKQNMMR